MRVKFDRIIKNDIEVEIYDEELHAKSGDIIVEFSKYEKDHGVFRPLFVVKGYFEKRFIDKYGTDSEEIRHHGTGYVDCFDLETGHIIRLQYYEYRILKDSDSIRNQFVKRWETAKEIMEVINERRAS